MLEEFFSQIKTWLATISEDLRELRAETNAMRQETAALRLEIIAMHEQTREMMAKMNDLIARVEMLHGIERNSDDTDASDELSDDDDVSGWKM
jgi:uncharacterized coiled-coil DUF342 family protein